MCLASRNFGKVSFAKLEDRARFLMSKLDKIRYGVDIGRFATKGSPHISLLGDFSAVRDLGGGKLAPAIYSRLSNAGLFSGTRSLAN